MHRVGGIRRLRRAAHGHALRAAQDMRVRLSSVRRRCFAPIDDYVNHVAFWELGMKASEEAGMLKIHRLKRSSCPPLWLCVASGHS